MAAISRTLDSLKHFSVGSISFYGYQSIYDDDTEYDSQEGKYYYIEDGARVYVNKFGYQDYYYYSDTDGSRVYIDEYEYGWYYFTNLNDVHYIDNINEYIQEHSSGQVVVDDIAFNVTFSAAAEPSPDVYADLNWTKTDDWYYSNGEWLLDTVVDVDLLGYISNWSFNYPKTWKIKRLDYFRDESYDACGGTTPPDTHLTSVNFSLADDLSVLTTIEGIFQGCNSLESVNFSNAVFTVLTNADYAFAGVDLKTITFKSGFTNFPALVSAYEFGDADGNEPICINSLTEILLASPNLTTDVEDLGIAYSINNIIYFLAGSNEVNLINGAAASGSITVPAAITIAGTQFAVEEVSWRAFKDNLDITSLTIANGVETIKNEAFSGCDNITSLTIPSSVTYVGNDAFYIGYPASKVTSLNITSNVTLGYASGYGGAGLFIKSGKQYYEVLTKSTLSYIKNDGTQSDLTFPSSVTVGSNTFTIVDLSTTWENDDVITEIIIPNTITSIHSYFFEYFTNLSSVAYNSNAVGALLQEIPSASKSKLLEINIYDDVTSIAQNAFKNFDKLKRVYISGSSHITSIGASAFYNCYDLQFIDDLPSGITSFGGNAFNGCGTLAKITFPASLTSVGTYAFYYCNSLSRVDAASIAALCGITYADEYAAPFRRSGYGNIYINDTLVTSLTIPNTVTTINSYAFYGVQATSITIPNSVTSIGTMAFAECTAVDTITVPNTVTTIGANAFKNVTNIMYSGSATGSPWGALCVNGYVDGDFIYSDSTKTTLRFYIGNSASVTVASTVTEIGSNAFKNNYSVTSISLPSGLTTIGGSAFYGCENLATINIPSSLTTLSSYAFYDCRSISSLDFSACTGLTAINQYTFAICISLAQVQLPNSVTTIGGHAFESTRITSLVIPSSMTTIGSYAFSFSPIQPDYSNATVTTISGYAFSHSSISTINIPSTVTSIGNHAFEYCENARSMTLPSTNITMGTEVFYGVSLDTFTTSNTGDLSSLALTLYNNHVYYDILTATTLGIKKTTSNYEMAEYVPTNGIVTAGNTFSIVKCDFQGATWINEIKVPNTVTYLRVENCTNLGIISNIENSVLDKITGNCFMNCHNLTGHLVLPSTITSIGEWAFGVVTTQPSFTVDLRNLDPTNITIASAAFQNANASRFTGFTNLSGVANYPFGANI